MKRNINNVIRTLDFYATNLKTLKDPNEAIDKLLVVYKYARLYSNKNNWKTFNIKVKKCEKSMPYKYILNIPAKFQYSTSYYEKRKKTLDNFDSHDEILDYIVSLGRNYIYFQHSFEFIIPNVTGIDAIDLTNLCYETSNYISKVCNKLKLKSKQVKINPGFDERLNLYDGNGYHYINIIHLEDKRYIVDCTYKQFFDVSQNLLERMGICGLSGPSLGIYMLQNSSRKKTAEELLQNGWIEMTDINVKNYFDAFVLHYRNALYYEMLGYIDFNTKYSSNDYENFIFGDDNQGNYEPLEGLGWQKRKMKNDNLKFKTDQEIINNIKGV